MAKREIIAMLLAGGQGSRLGSMTKNIAKPAVSFGGKYRIIDFGLSNCMNSGVSTVGVLTQYKPFSLHSYVGIGSAWDLETSYDGGGLSVLSPYVGEKGGRWYKGTANALYENMKYINNLDPEQVLIIAGDHIYKMDYNKMLQFHKENNADVTISVMEVPIEEAFRFGVVAVDADMQVYKFQEKPPKPESNLVSMGIYIFKWSVLKQALIEDEEDEDSEKDFGKNILPKLLKEGKRLFAYSFNGYWRDVGTIESYYETNMELLAENPPIDLYDGSFSVYSNSEALPPQVIGKKASVINSIVDNGCNIFGTLENSIVHANVYIAEGSVVKNSIILPNVRIGSGAILDKVIVGYDTVIEENCEIGLEKPDKEQQGGITLIEGVMTVPKGTKIAAGCSYNKEGGERHE